LQGESVICDLQQAADDWHALDEEGPRGAEHQRETPRAVQAITEASLQPLSQRSRPSPRKNRTPPGNRQCDIRSSISRSWSRSSPLSS